MAYLTIAEARSKFGKSESTYRRLIRSVRNSGDPQKRKLIKPSEDEIAENRRNNVTYAYTIAEDLIQQELLGVEAKPEQGSEPSPSSAPNADLFEQIQQRHDREVERLESLLDAEKKEKMELLKNAQEDKRLFANATGRLTQLLALPGMAEKWEGAATSTAVVGESTERRPKSPEKPAPAVPVARKNAEKAKPKPSKAKISKRPPLWQRLVQAVR